MLFKNFNWQDFLLAAAVFSLIWYMGVWLLFYRKRQAALDAPLAHSWQDRVDVLEDDVLGRPALEPGVSVLEADDFGFGGLDQNEQLGVLPDVQEDIKSACRELEAGLGKKDDFFAAFRLIRDRYDIPENAREPLNEFIREHVPFFLSDEELEDLWL